MPIYEFICARCDTRFEDLILKEGDLREVACSSCGSPQVEKTFSVFGMAGSLEHPATSGCGS
jgi:putative FmdB family regulatory protein